jgi:hypothetical protein
VRTIETVETDRGRYLGYVRLVGRRRLDAQLPERLVSVPPEYKNTPLLRAPEQNVEPEPPEG